MSSETRITPDRMVLVGAFLAMLAYIQDIRYDFILDDVPLILLNERIQSWRNWKSLFVTDLFEVKHAQGTMELGGLLYRPIYRLWQMANAQLFGLILPWWHITSILLHLGATFLVYQIGIKLLKGRWTAAVAALLFAFHPIHAESVAYVTASTDLLVTVFALISFLAYFRFREEGGSPVYFIVSILAAALAMLSKETSAMFPWLLVAYEALRENTESTAKGLKKFLWTAPYFAIVGIYVIVRSVLFGLSSGSAPAGNRLTELLDIPLVLIVYLRNLLWPFRLSFFYPGEWVLRWTLLRSIVIAAIVVAAGYLWTRYRDRYSMKMLLLWSAILSIPAALVVFTFVPENWVHDRHMYFVSVPVCLIVAEMLTHRKWPLKASIALSATILAAFLVSLAVQLPRFSDNETIYASALKVAPSSLLARGYYAQALWDYGHHEESLREFATLTEMAPHSSEIHEAYGTVLVQLGRENEAMTEFTTALQWTPKPTAFRALVLSEVAQIELNRSEFPEAADHMREAVKIEPQTLNYHSLLAQALTHEGRTEEADEETKLEASLRQRYAQDHRHSSD
jgi:tetratricopeptide (TPR) repeat protein